MIYKVGMLCKHFKGADLLEKNIYKIEKIGVDGLDIDESSIVYTGEGNIKNARNLIIYSNIFQDNKLFCREYDDISQELSREKQEMYMQSIRIQPLSSEEIEIVQSDDFIKNKKQLVLKKYSR